MNTQGNQQHSGNLNEFIDSIPVEGSLGVLALGAVGVIAWRKKRAAAGVPVMQGNTLIRKQNIEKKDI